MTIEYYSEEDVMNKPFDVARNDFKLRFKDEKAVEAINRLTATRKFTGCVYMRDRYTALVSGLLPQQIRPETVEFYFRKYEEKNIPRNPERFLADQNIEVTRELATRMGGTLLMPRRTKR